MKAREKNPRAKEREKARARRAVRPKGPRERAKVRARRAAMQKSPRVLQQQPSLS